MKTSLFVIGKISGAHAELCKDYIKRITLPFTVRVFTAHDQKQECRALMEALPPKAFVIALDERGDDLSSRAFAEKLAKLQDQGVGELVFLIGGADGFTSEVRARADYVLGLGHKTWPHKLVRVMFLEQLYRAFQINAGHPYHRD